MDFSIWIQSPYDWGILFLSALFVGISKTGIQGLSLTCSANDGCDFRGQTLYRPDIAEFCVWPI